MVRVALILTGEIRTFDQTYQVISDHLIAPNKADVFIHCNKSKYKTTVDFPEDTFAKKWGDCVKRVAFWDTQTDAEHKLLKESILSVKPGTSVEVFNRTSQGNRHYMANNSGTLYEYTQIMKCAQLLIAYEHEHKFKYDVVIRSRLDAVFIDPFNVKPFFQPDAEQEKLLPAGSDQDKIIQYVQCLGHPKLIRQCTSINLALEKMLTGQKEWKNVLSSPRPTRAIATLAKRLPFVHTLRKNVIWICNRLAFQLLYPLIHFYGDYDNKTSHSWDSESQFTQHANWNGLVHVDYHGEIEERYLVSRAANQHVMLGTTINRVEVNPNLMFTVFRPSTYRFDRD